MSTADDVARQWHSLYCRKRRAELKLKLRTAGNCSMFMEQDLGQKK